MALTPYFWHPVIESDVEQGSCSSGEDGYNREPSWRAGCSAVDSLFHLETGCREERSEYQVELLNSVVKVSTEVNTAASLYSHF